MQARDALTALEGRMTLTPYELGSYASGGRRFEKIVRFATVDCSKAGWLKKQKGRWSITEEGKVAYEQLTDPEQFYKKATSLYWKWKKSQEDAEQGEESEEGETSKAAVVTLEEAVEAAWTEITHFLHNMNPYDFQDLVGALLRGLGYYIAWTAPPGKDGGIDLVATLDALGTRSPRVKVQVKRQFATVTVDGLRSFMATLGPDDVGLFVSLGGCPNVTQNEARLHPNQKVTLIDIEQFYDLWVEHYPKLSDEDRRLLPLRPIYFLDPE